VAIASGVQFITHDGVANMIRDKYPGIQFSGKSVSAQDGIGINSILLPGSKSAADCLIGSRFVVRADIRQFARGWNPLK